MMREIIFRGKSVVDGSWKYGDLSYSRSLERYAISLGMETTVVDQFTLGQFTGLHDKNGGEIYEGDIIFEENTCRHILLGTSHIYAIVFDHGSFCREWYNNQKGKNIRQTISLYDWNDDIDLRNYEVIGNIYDSPELYEKIKREGSCNVFRTKRDIASFEKFAKIRRDKNEGQKK